MSCHSDECSSNSSMLLRVLLYTLGLAVGTIVILSLPELKRYIKISSM
jgi:hypothetical protein